MTVTAHNMLPPADKTFGPNPCVANGRSYTCAVGSVILVQDFDAQVLAANGWIQATQGGTGTTAQRPNPTTCQGVSYLDTTLGYTIVSDGKVWRNKITGAAV
jgi:hypothetical protein